MFALSDVDIGRGHVPQFKKNGIKKYKDRKKKIRGKATMKKIHDHLPPTLLYFMALFSDIYLVSLVAPPFPIKPVSP